jgi:hypothetical protein
MLSFHEIESRWGAPIADYVLAEVEKAARIPASETANLDPETRLANAIRIQDAWKQNHQHAA